jgi:hypothetical protein
VVWVVLTATLLVGCTGAGGGRDTVPVPGTSAETLTDPPTAEPVDQQQVFDDVTATNRAAALAWSRRVVGSLVLPSGSVRLDRESPIFRRGAQVGTSPSDPGLTRTAWWSVPTSRDELSRFLLTHHPPGHVRYPGTDVGGPEDSPYLDYDGDSPDPAAFTGVTLGVEWRQGAGTTFVRARTFLLARGVRDPAAAVVPPVQRVRVSYDALGAWPRTDRRQREWDGTDREARRVVRALDALPASAVPSPFGSCLPQTADQDVRVLVEDAAGLLRAVVHAPYCSGQLVVTRDGKQTVGMLDPWTLVPVLSRLLGDG